MSRGCGCGGGQCNCALEAGNAYISVSGSGTATDKYRISGIPPGLTATSSSTITTTITGVGTQTTPWNITSTLNPLPLDGLSDVVISGTPTTGYVLAFNGTNWAPVPATTAAVGAINVGNGIGGNGTSGTPLVARLLTGGFLDFSSAQIRIAPDGQGFMGLGFSSAAARDAQYTSWGISPAIGHKAWLEDRSTLTVRGSGKWWEFTPEINQSWQINRAAAGLEDSYTGTGSLVAGTLTNLPSGRYRIDYIANQSGGSNGVYANTQELYVNGVVVDYCQIDMRFGLLPAGNSFFYTFAGGAMTLVMLSTNQPGAPSATRVATIGTRILVTYLGRT